MKYFIMFLFILKDHPILSFLAIVGFGFLGYIFLPKKFKTPFLVFSIIIFIIYFFNFFLGNIVINPYLERFGKKGEGMVVDISETANMYNEEPVMRYDVMIKTEDSKTILTYFFTSDFNISHPESWNTYRYPPTGIKFNARYLKDYPRAFIIIGNDDSEYGRWLNSIKDVKEINRLRNELKMDPENEELKEKLKSLTD